MSSHHDVENWNQLGQAGNKFYQNFYHQKPIGTIRHVPWWSLLRLLSWYPITPVKSVQLTWKWCTCWFHLLDLKIQHQDSNTITGHQRNILSHFVMPSIISMSQLVMFLVNTWQHVACDGGFKVSAAVTSWHWLNTKIQWEYGTLQCRQLYELEIISFNSLGPGDTIWRWRSWSTLVQVMACCLTAPSHCHYHQ